MHQGWMLSLLLLPLATQAGGLTAPAPANPRGNSLLEKTAITLSYNPSYKQSSWVFYPLGKEQLQDCYDRPSNFRADPVLACGERAELSDYKNSGYDRGHLSPAGDNKWSSEAMSESFLLSNISPQPAKFNRGLWSRLETLVRAWAAKSALWVTTGPVLEGGLETIGDGAVAVPNYFYKVLARQDGTGAIALLLPNDADQSLAGYAVSVDELENFARLDFLKGMKNEERLEAGLDKSRWDFKAKFQYGECQRQRQGQGQPLDLLSFAR